MPPTVGTTPDRAYLSILQWPDALAADESRCADLLAAAIGVDQRTALLLVRRGTPQVVRLLPAADAQRAITALHSAGVMAMAPTQAAMRALGRPVLAKRLIASLGRGPDAMLAVEGWGGGRGESFAFRAGDLFLIVRAALKSTVSTTRPEDSAPSALAPRPLTRPWGSPALIRDVVEGVSLDDVVPGRTDRTNLTEIVDLHLADGRHARISGEKFNFDILESGRGLSDRENTDKLAVLLAEQSPRAIVDTGFGQFRCPADIIAQHTHTVGGTTISKSTELPAFDFYSAWVSMVYRAMLSA